MVGSTNHPRSNPDGRPPPVNNVKPSCRANSRYFRTVASCAALLRGPKSTPSVKAPPMRLLPEKEILLTSGWAHRCAPIWAPVPVTTFNTLAGRFTCRAMAASSNSSGVISDGLRTTVQPAARAGAKRHRCSLASIELCREVSVVSEGRSRIFKCRYAPRQAACRYFEQRDLPACQPAGGSLAQTPGDSWRDPAPASSASRGMPRVPPARLDLHPGQSPRRHPRTTLRSQDRCDRKYPVIADRTSLHLMKSRVCMLTIQLRRNSASSMISMTVGLVAPAAVTNSSRNCSQSVARAASHPNPRARARKSGV